MSGSDPDARDKEQPLRLPHGGGEKEEQGEDSRAKGKRHFQSAKLGGYKREMPNERRGGELPQICDRNEK